MTATAPEKLTSPYDGNVTTWYFGEADPHGVGRPFEVKASSLARAVRLFRVGALFPHRYAKGRIASDGADEQGRSSTVYLSSAPDAYVPVHVQEKGKGRVEVARIPPVGEDIDPRTLRMLGTALPEEAGAATTTALALAGSATGLQNARRTDLEVKTGELQAAMLALEQQKAALALQVTQIKAELKRRMEQIWIIELFLGCHEEVLVLREGEPAPMDTPIAVRQRVLCMDEEIAAWDWLQNPERIGEFSAQDLGAFDQWLLDPMHLHEVCPWPKAIVGFRVRRKTKDRPHLQGLEGMFQKMEEEAADAMTYLLVRNGERLFRLWIDVNLFPRLFASAKDAEIAGSAEWRSDRERAQERMKHQVAGLVAVQGLIERSELLHPLPPDLNVFDPACADRFALIRDDEEHKALADDTDELAHVTWHDVTAMREVPRDPAFGGGTERRSVVVRKGYKRWLQEQIAAGIRVFYVGTRWGGKGDTLEGRTGVRTVGSWPRHGEVYVLDEYDAEHKGWGRPGSFLYLPGDEVWKRDEDGWAVPVKREKRVRFRCYNSEVFPIDFVSWRVLEHLIRDRGQREHYGDFFRTAFDWWRIAKAQAERERPFVDLVLRRVGADLDDDAARARVERLVRWWKLKVKEHRTIDADDAKALRMIEQAWQRGEDWTDDPEARLYAAMRRSA